MSPEKKYLKWRQGPRVGCLFARLIAVKPDRYGQRIVRVSSTGAPAVVAKRIATAVSGIMADKDATAALLLFPELRSLERTARIMLALGAEPDWTVTPMAVPSPPKKFVALNITRAINFGKETCPSEALVLGNFPKFPPTRRAPVTALEVFTGEPRPFGPLDDVATLKANLAHMPLHLPSHDMFLTMWRGSIDGRARQLGGTDNRAKAKASLVITSALAKRLGCTP